MKIRKTNLLIIGSLFLIIFISGCIATAIKDVKNQDNVGKKVTVSGTVKNTIKLGTLSGFTIEDETDSISVSSQALPAEGDKISVTGVLIKDTLLGYYIKVD